jgi:XTP/dITP diphosphohydrolase
MFTLIFGTNNRKKGIELAELLAPYSIEVRTLADFDKKLDVVEDGQKFLDNARKKAIEQAKFLNAWVVGEDSGLCVDALGGAPGVYSARFAADPTGVPAQSNANDDDNNRLLLEKLLGIPLEKRAAHYTCAAVLADPTGAVYGEAEGHCRGRILFEHSGESGFGYDPLFEVVEYHQTFGTLHPAVKRAISHRARAMRKLIPTIIALRLAVRTILFLICFLFSVGCLHAQRPQNVDRLNINARFITCLIPDGNDGAFIGTEDHGIYHYDKDGKVTQYTDKDGLSDPNAYALAIDKKQRLWVGHLNTGVSVFNGKDWQNYDVIDGPIGERIFDIQLCPSDGDVWIATSAGITRYRIETDDWEHYTREDGLLEDQASSLAFTNDGTLIVGTQCHGLALFERNRDGSYKHMKNVIAPERFGLNNISPVPLVPQGNGLPSNHINQIIVSQNTGNTIWIATSAGLVMSTPKLDGMSFVRGRDYADKVRGLYGGVPRGWQECSKEVMDRLLPEDYITCLAEDANGIIWAGTRQRGFVAIDPKTWQRELGDHDSLGLPDNYVRALLPMSDGLSLVASYGGGVVKSKSAIKLQGLDKPMDMRRQYSLTSNRYVLSALPSPIKPPTAEQLKAMYERLKAIKPEENPPKIIALNDDWRTQGDWIDRYGRHSAVLCAQGGGGFNYYGGYFGDEMESTGWIGRNYLQKDDQLRYWVHWRESDDKRVLRCLDLGGRKQSEWDDHKEEYPLTLDGPHVYGTFRIPPGQYVMSLYFFNKDGHEGMNRLRDYTISVRTMTMPPGLFERLGGPNVHAENHYFNAPIGATGRVRDFWGGVYKRFLVTVKENEYVTFRLDAHYSFNTIVSGVFFDCVQDMKSTARLQNPFPDRQPTAWERVMNRVEPLPWWGIQSMDTILCLRDSNPQWFYKNGRKDLLTLTRSFVKWEDSKLISVLELDPADKEKIRPDVATLLRNTQMHDFADLVDFTKLKYSSYRWDARTLIGRTKALIHEWDYPAFYRFSDEGKSRQTW